MAGTVGNAVTFSRSIKAQISSGLVESMSTYVAQLKKLPPTPQSMPCPWLTGAAVSTVSALVISHAFEWYSTFAIKSLWTLGTALGNPVVPPVGVIVAASIGSGLRASSIARPAAVTALRPIRFS